MFRDREFTPHSGEHMKKITTIGLTLLLLAGSASAKSKLILDKTVGLAENEKIEVLAYKGEKKTVKVRADTGITVRPFASFPEAAQKEILAWVADEVFESSSQLRVRIKENKEKVSVDKIDRVRNDITLKRGDIESIIYEVELENRGDVALDGIMAETFVFYEKRVNGKECKRCAVACSKLNILPYKKEIFTSRNVEIEDIVTRHDAFDSNGVWVSSTDCVDDKLKGILVVLKRTNRQGKIITREFKKGRPPKPKDRPEYYCARCLKNK